MTTRRAFLQIAAVTAAPLALPAVSQVAAARADHALVLFESSLVPAAFARRVQSRGIAAQAIRDGDVTEAWLRAVRPAWQRGRASIAGLTTPAALFCLEQFAYLHGLRVVFHAEHVLLRDGSVRHEVQRAPQRVTAATLHRAGPRWPQRLADALIAPAVHGARRPGPSLAGLEPALPAGATLLTSWIIA